MHGKKLCSAKPMGTFNRDPSMIHQRSYGPDTIKLRFKSAVWAHCGLLSTHSYSRRQLGLLFGGHCGPSHVAFAIVAIFGFQSHIFGFQIFRLVQTLFKYCTHA